MRSNPPQEMPSNTPDVTKLVFGIASKVPTYYYCIYQCVLFWTFARFLRRPWVFSRALRCGARRGTACVPRRKFGSPAGSVARALGVLSHEIRQEIVGSFAAELEPSSQWNAHMPAVCSTAVKALYFVAATVQQQSHIFVWTTAKRVWTLLACL